MNVGDKFTRNGKTYVVTQVWGENYGMREWGDNYGMRELADEVKEVPVFEETPEVKEEAPKKKVVRRKKA